MSFPRYPRYVASGVAWLGDIPAHWRVLPLKAVATCNDDVLPESTAEGTLIEYLEISGVEAGRGITQTETLTFGSAPSRARRVVHHGDVLISTVRTYLRAIATVANPPENLIASTGFAAIRPKAVQPGFLGHLLHCEYLISAVIARSVGISYPAINASDLMCLKGPFPPFEEQGAIAAFLDRETAKIDTLVEEQRRLIDLLKEKRQAVISRAVTKGLNPNVPTRDSGVEWLGLIPKHWDSGTLTRVADRVVVGIAEAATHAYADEGVAILRSTNIRAGKIVGEILYVTPEFAEGRATKLINAGDLVTVRTGNAGVTVVVPESLDGCQCFTMLITSLSKLGLSAFYCYALNSLPSQRYFSLEGWGTAQVNISVPILKALPVAIPPLTEQHAIVKYLDGATAKLDELVAEAESAMRLLGERRTALISAAVTGKIDVRDSTDLLTAWAETKADIAAGRFVSESAKAHVARVRAMAKRDD